MPLDRVDIRTLYEGHRINLEIHTLRGSDGSTVEKEVGRHPGAVLVVPLLDNGRVVLIRNRRVAVDEVLWELPAGTLESPEPPIDCAHRELREEAGYIASFMEPLLAFWSAPGLWDERMHAFVATGLEHVGTSLEAGEEIEPVAVPWDEALAMIERGDIVDGKTITALLFHERFGQQFRRGHHGP